MMEKITALLLSILMAVCPMAAENLSGTGRSVYEFGDATKLEAYPPMTNTRYCLEQEKKLTIGYLGGSITNGYTASRKVVKGRALSSGGKIADSFVNRITDWFKTSYPDCEITGVNSGISDTATNFGIFRLEDTLMNTDGHDMPDLVFIEFTSNDWDLSGCLKQGSKEFKLEIESLVRNIYTLNPYADIVFVYTTRSSGSTSRSAYNAIAKDYNITAIDMGIPLQKLMTANGASNEKEGTFFYTVDDLHPSAEGYRVYAEECVIPVLKTELDAVTIGTRLRPMDYIHKQTSTGELMLNPRILPATEFDDLVGTYSFVDYAGSTYFNLKTNAQTAYKPTEKALKAASPDVSCSFSFDGTVFGLIFSMQSGADIEMEYSVDGGDWKPFYIDDRNLGFQRYAHLQIYMNEMYLEKGSHKVELRFKEGTDGKTNVLLVAAAVA